MLLIALGNSGDAGALPVIERLLEDPSPLVRGAACGHWRGSPIKARSIAVVRDICRASPIPMSAANGSRKPRFPAVTANTQLSFACRADAVETGSNRPQREEEHHDRTRTRTIVTSIAGLPLAAILADPRLAAMPRKRWRPSASPRPARKVEAALRCRQDTGAIGAAGHEWWASTTKSRRWDGIRQGGLPRPRRHLYEGKVRPIRRRRRP